MLRTLLSSVIGAAAGALIGLALAAVAILAGDVMALDRAWVASLCAGIGAFAGALIGFAAGATQALAGGKMVQIICAVGLGAIAGAAIVYGTGRIKPGGWLILGACVGAFLAGATTIIWARWNRSPAPPIAGELTGAIARPEP